MSLFELYIISECVVATISLSSVHVKYATLAQVNLNTCIHIFGHAPLSCTLPWLLNDTSQTSVASFNHLQSISIPDNVTYINSLDIVPANYEKYPINA